LGENNFSVTCVINDNVMTWTCGQQVTSRPP